MSGVLLDTCAVIWFAEGRLPQSAVATLRPFVDANEVFYSPISAWEIGVLGRPRPHGPRLRFDPNPTAWFNKFRVGPGLREARLSCEVALAASLLPAGIHLDPADRFLIAEAQQRGIPLVTSDRRIIGYAAQGVLDVIECRPLLD